LEEVAEVVAIDPESRPVLDKDEILEDPLSALDICASLVTVLSQDNVGSNDESEHEIEKSEATQIIGLAHYSVKEYLTSERIQNGPAKLYGLEEDISNAIMADCCTGYLLQFHSAELFCDETVRTHKLALYSAKFWISHVRSSKESATQALIMELFVDDSYVNWIRMHDLHRPWEGLDIKRRTDASPLYFASLEGLIESVRCLIHGPGANVNAQGEFYGNALQAASGRGHEAVVKLLLDAGADVNAQGGFYGNALQAASGRGLEAVVKLLLDAGANVNAQGGRYGNALQAASTGGHEAVVKLLLDAGAVSQD
jgi:hypothetical protein